MAIEDNNNPVPTGQEYHLEISQSVQDYENSVPLIQDKTTYARAYFDYQPLNNLSKGDYRAELELVLKVGLAKKSTTLISLNSITLEPGKPVSIERQRLHWGLSFNFDLNSVWADNPESISAGNLNLILNPTGSSYKFVADADSIDISVVLSPSLKVTCLLLRYWDAESDDYVMPDPVQVGAIRDFVVSAFPVAENNVEWNTITVQATNEFQSLSKLTKSRPDAEEAASLAIRELLLQTTVHRNMDTFCNPNSDPEKGWPNTYDIRTIYLAVFNDPSDRLGGAAIDSPRFPVHNIAGASVVDLNGQIGAHELAHILGREHPGIPWRRNYGPFLGQRKEDKKLNKKYKNHKKAYMGFLNVDSNTVQGLNINPRFIIPKVYEPNLYFDLMTYRDPQWLSDYSYNEIKKRLDELYRDSYKKFFQAPKKARVAIGEYDLNQQTGRILFVLPTSYMGFDLQLERYRKEVDRELNQDGRLDSYEKLSKNRKIQLICISKDKKTHPTKLRVYHRLPDSDRANGEKQRDMPNFGIFQATFDKTNVEKIRLKVANNVVDVLEGNNVGSLAYSTLLDKLVCCLKKTTKDKQPRKTRIEHPVRYMKNNTDQGLLFYYDVLEDEYYLRFNWLAKTTEIISETNNVGKGGKGKNLLPQTNEGSAEEHEDGDGFLDFKLISVIQCKRPDSEEWVTIMVSTRRKGKTWISPDLVERQESITDPEFRDKPFYPLLSKKSRSLHSLINDKIEVRVLFSAGFVYEVLPVNNKISAKIYFPNEFLQNQHDHNEDLNYFDKQDTSLKDLPLDNLQNRSGKHRPMHHKATKKAGRRR